ncbi:MAG: hypothetical protein L0332_35815 [Chloroflexi bacterium]|nr:hypothetical protein [Chloroflexota bacterium]MCI0732065.1 hypothetical protein [Chloroflexota bacterium]
MSTKILDRFKKQEAENVAMFMKFNRWSRVMVEVLIREQEQKLLASDLPVDEEQPESFWVELP